ncbi:thiolase family protein [Streptomyces sp. NPDC046805]|uniref:thiolase family protein n=1 Tax=Streptomyces sp. NPDC046805 TaxID=3155134 RepID=UPI0033EAADA5
MTEVFVAGTGMTRFTGHGPGTARALAAEAAQAALSDAGLSFADVDTLIAGAGHPLSPRGSIVARELGLTGIPVQHVVNASATGLAAIDAAMRTVESGRADVALVLGYDAPEVDIPLEQVIAAEGSRPPAVSFALWARRRMHEVGTTREHLAAVAAKNWNYARQSPYAARQAAEPVTTERVLAASTVADPFTSMMCTPWGEGAAAVVLCSDRARATHGGRPAVRLAASALCSERYAPRQVLDGVVAAAPELTRHTAMQAMRAAGVTARDLDLVQVHDAFAVEELVYLEQLGLTEPGETEKLLLEGAFGPGSRARFGLPEVSTDGGLIARGHPGAPTGVAQVWETVRRMRTVASDRVGLCHLVGAGPVCVTQVYIREDPS